MSVSIPTKSNWIVKMCVLKWCVETRLTFRHLLMRWIAQGGCQKSGPSRPVRSSLARRKKMRRSFGLKQFPPLSYARNGQQGKENRKECEGLTLSKNPSPWAAARPILPSLHCDPCASLSSTEFLLLVSWSCTNCWKDNKNKTISQFWCFVIS